MKNAGYKRTIARLLSSPIHRENTAQNPFKRHGRKCLILGGYKIGDSAAHKQVFVGDFVVESSRSGISV